MHVTPRALRPASLLANGSLAGLAGMIVLELFEATVERRALGREPVYSSRAILGRLVPELARGGAHRELVALAARTAYALSLALGFARVRSLLPPSTASSAALFAAAIVGGELALGPRAGVVPRLSRWSRSEVLLLVAHAAVYAVVTASALDRLDAQKQIGPVVSPPRRNALHRIAT